MKSKAASLTSQAQTRRGAKTLRAAPKEESHACTAPSAHSPQSPSPSRALLRTRLIRIHQTPPRRALLRAHPKFTPRRAGTVGLLLKGRNGEGGGEPGTCCHQTGSRQAAGARGPDLTFGVFNVPVAPRVRTPRDPLGYSPSSLSNTIVLRNEESFPGRSVLGSRRLDRSLWLRAAPGNGFETRGCLDYASINQNPGKANRRLHARFPSPSLLLPYQREFTEKRGGGTRRDPSVRPEQQRD